jgi:hypothetical protein
MSAITRHRSQYLNKIIDANTDIQASIFLEQLFLLPIDVQDKVIDEISHLGNCNCEAIAKIIGKYSTVYNNH